MLKFYILLATLALVSCEVKEAKVDSYKGLIEKAKGTEAVLQKKTDSIMRQQDSLSIPH